MKKKHGSYTLEISGQTLILHAYGPWNLKTANSMCFEAMKLVRTICDNPWACLSDVTEWELGTPDIWIPVKKFNTWANHHNQQCEVTVCTTAIQRSLIEKSIKTLTNVDKAFTTTKTEGLAWIESQGIAV